MKYLKWYCKTRWYKWTHAEYWPMWTYYFPLIPLWIYYGIKSRNLTLYRYINPGLKNGGLFDISKWDIYHLLPELTFPKTVRITSNENLMDVMNKHEMSFPIIAKPEKGYRGIGVFKISHEGEWHQYTKTNKGALLIQEFIDWPIELGIFYVRQPNQEKGNITGLTMKEFMQVRGDGVKTIETWMHENPRYALQIPRLGKNIDLNIVLASNENRVLEPIGNHNRGTLFKDGREHITQALIDRVDQIAKQIPGFYFGRFDVKCSSLAAMKQGKALKIIELNGALSEPTHMYDPNMGFFNAIRLLWKSHRDMLEIAILNKRLSNSRNN